MNTEEVPRTKIVFDAQIRPVIDLIDTLRQLGLEKDVSLPTIVVVGDQSSGKSSVLEALSGVQLPRGSGIVTRCPLELRMKSGGKSGWKGRLRYRPTDGSDVVQTFEKPEEVETFVKDAQVRLAGKDKGISVSVISLEIESPDVPDLTLVDLPGITRVAVEGQSTDVSEQIKSMIMGYISKENTIILVVVPANVDVATTEALKLAREVDPDGFRTLGVVTKPDIIDKGSESEIVSVVSNARFKLAKGYTLVQCRGQKQVDENMSLKDALKKEEEFFKNSDHFKDIREKELTGTINLSKKLSSVLYEHIKTCLPALRADIGHARGKVKQELDDIGEGVPEETDAKRKLLNKILQSFSETMSKIADGDMKFDDERTTKLLNLYMRARDAFEKFANDMEALTPKVGDQAFLNIIKDKVKNQRGSELPMFICYQVCKNLIKEVLGKFQPAAMQCLLTVNAIVGSVFESAAHLSANQYPEMEIAIKGIIDSTVQEQAEKICKDRISEIFRMEELVYSQERNFANSYEAVMKIVPPATGYNPEVFSECESKRLVEIVRNYMAICRHRLADFIPMTIILHVVKDSSKKIKDDVGNLLSDQDLSRYLCEGQEIVKKRRELKNKSERLHLAYEEVTRV